MSSNVKLLCVKCILQTMKLMVLKSVVFRMKISDSEDENVLQAAQVSKLCSIPFLLASLSYVYRKTTMLISAVSKTSEILIGW